MSGAVNQIGGPSIAGGQGGQVGQGGGNAGRAAPVGLAGRLESAVANLTILRVTTVVGTVTADGADAFDRVTELRLVPEGQAVASTSINMLLGDASNIMSPAFVEQDAYKQMHAAAVRDALAVRAQTVELLKQAYAAFKEHLNF